MPENGGKALKSQLWDLAIKVALLAIPLLLGWVVKLEVSNALQNEQIGQLEAKVASNAAVDDDISTIRESLVRLETTSIEMDKKVTKLYDILLDR